MIQELQQLLQSCLTDDIKLMSSQINLFQKDKSIFSNYSIFVQDLSRNIGSYLLLIKQVNHIEYLFIDLYINHIDIFTLNME